jgi:hypothetical protein
MASELILLSPCGRGKTWLGNLLLSKSWRGDVTRSVTRACGSHPLSQLRLSAFAAKASYPSPARREGA